MLRFADFLGQAHIQRLLQRALVRGRLSHAYLFLGPAGLGKRTLARTLAAAVNCQAGGGEPCGVCPSCYKMAQGNHPDLYVLTSDGASIKIEQIRELETRVAYKPYEGRYKVFIIENAERMTEAAGNSLLKTLEEPPAATLFLLIAEGEGLLPTLVSRCEPLLFRPVPTQELTAYLKARLPEVAPAQLQLAAAAAGGRIGRALQLVHDPALTAMREEAKNLYQCLRREGLPAAYTQALAWEKRKGELEAFLEQLSLWYRELWQRELGLAPSSPSASDPVPTAPAGTGTLAGLWQALRQIERTRRDLKQNANVKLALINLFVTLAGQAREKAVFPNYAAPGGSPA